MTQFVKKATQFVAAAMMAMSLGAGIAVAAPTTANASSFIIATRTPAVLRLSVPQRAALLLLAGQASHLQGETITLCPQGNGTQVFKTVNGDVVATVFTTGRVTRTVDLPTGQVTKVNLTKAYHTFGGSSEYRDLAANIQVL